MSDEQSEKTPGPFSGPGFMAALVVVVIVVVLGIVLAVSALRKPSADPNPTGPPSPSASTSSASTPAPTPSASGSASSGAGGASVCGLGGEVMAGKLTVAPAAVWEYQGTTAYPTSETAGPGLTTGDGVRTCFQRSPEGALFAAANAVVQGTDPAHAKPWLTYFVAEGPNRAAVLAQGSDDTDTSGTRVQIAGFRVLAYDGNAARVDVAVTGSSGGQTATLSMVYDLVWQGRDWKLNVKDPRAPIAVAQIPSVAGYVAWGE